MGTRQLALFGPSVPVYVPGEDPAVKCRLRPMRLAAPVAGMLFDMGGVLYDDTAWRRWLPRTVLAGLVASALSVLADWAVVRGYMTIENREEEQADCHDPL